MSSATKFNREYAGYTRFDIPYREASRSDDEEQKSEVEIAQDLIAEIRQELDRAEAAVFNPDGKTFRLAMLNVHDLAQSLFP